MTKKKKRALPNIEVLIIGVFVISFFLMVLPKCEDSREEYQQIAQDTVDVACLIDAGQDPHTYSATPADRRTIEEAD